MSWPFSFISAHLWNSSIAFGGSISATSTAFSVVISLAVELREVIITCTNQTFEALQLRCNRCGKGRLGL